MERRLDESSKAASEAATSGQAMAARVRGLQEEVGQLSIFLKWFRNLSGARLGSGSDGLQGATGDKMAIRLGLQSVPRLKVILS